ncbi:hypothetical protein GALMADRAFT_223608 [Galerina marginata CBS 339.88]|uniref:Uncharacterized protein n=1 Tax=Galerina marginata (strain CBS 339.88) TaxID=685588 RepID=A0A067T8D0_GALM3|nr:hypothetical protein GALMADRAFT_223608 [Galerina marginata CBS 339.88]
MIQTSESPQGLPSRVPVTPMRRLLSKLEFTARPILALGKRNRELSYGPSTEGLCLLATAAETTLAGLPETTLPSKSLEPDLSNAQNKMTLRACLAIQQHDQPLDAIVVTTLPSYPFCCHEDLLTMPRDQLVEVATLFNSHLPHTTQIDLSESATDAHIRHCIESLVGIVPQTPGAPKAVKSRRIAPQHHRSLLPPSSPLAMRLSRRRGLSHISSPSGLLERLEEEDEGDFFTDLRVPKRRKVSESATAPIRFSYERDNMDVDFASSRSSSFSASFDVSFSPVNTWSSDLDMAASSPLQNRGPTSFTFDAGPSSLKQDGGFLGSRSRSRLNSSRGTASKDTRAPQICLPMDMLHMNSVSPVRRCVERRIRKDIS